MELSLPKVKVSPFRSATCLTGRPFWTMKIEWNSASRGRCTSASEPGAWASACTPVRPPNQANWMSPRLKPATTAA